MFQIAVLDDDPVMLNLYQDSLAPFGIEVRPFQRVQDFNTDVLVNFNQGNPYEVVIVDYLLYDPSTGQEQSFSTEQVVRALRMVDPRLKFILVSGANPSRTLIGLCHASFPRSVLSDYPGMLADRAKKLAGLSEMVEAVFS